MSGMNIWTTLRSKVRDGPMALFVFIAGFLALVLGLIFTYADYLSSLFGLLSLQTVFALQIPGGELVIKSMAMAPQVGQMVFMTYYTLDTSRRWPLVVAVAWFILDFVSDVQHNSGSTLLPLGGGLNLTPTVGVAAGVNVMWFSFGAELFLVAGSAIVFTLLTDAVREFFLLWYGTGKAIRDAKEQAKGGKKGNQNQQQQGNQQKNVQQQAKQQQRPNNGQQRQGQGNLPQGQPRREAPQPSLQSWIDAIDADDLP